MGLIEAGTKDRTQPNSIINHDKPRAPSQLVGALANRGISVLLYDTMHLEEKSEEWRKMKCPIYDLGTHNETREENVVIVPSDELFVKPPTLPSYTSAPTFVIWSSGWQFNCIKNGSENGLKTHLSFLLVPF